MHRALSWLATAGSLCLLFIFVRAAFSANPKDSPRGVLFLFAIVLGIVVLHRVTANGAMLKKPWARTISRVIASFYLLGFPVGTAIGLYLLRNTGERRWNSIEAVRNAPSA
jgi:hypothetical protein